MIHRHFHSRSGEHLPGKSCSRKAFVQGHRRGLGNCSEEHYGQRLWCSYCLGSDLSEQGHLQRKVCSHARYLTSVLVVVVLALWVAMKNSVVRFRSIQKMMTSIPSEHVMVWAWDLSCDVGGVGHDANVVYQKDLCRQPRPNFFPQAKSEDSKHGLVPHQDLSFPQVCLHTSMRLFQGQVSEAWENPIQTPIEHVAED